MTTATTTPVSQINDLIGWMRKSNRATRAARFLPNIFDIGYQMTTWNFHFWGSADDASLLQWIRFHYLPLHENHSCRSSESALRLFCTTIPTRNNSKTLNLTQSPLLVWCFRRSSRRSIVNSLMTNPASDKSEIETRLSRRQIERPESRRLVKTGA